jgi:hypothetical protein
LGQHTFMEYEAERIAQVTQRLFRICNRILVAANCLETA